jgi:nucleoside triphosphatase
MKKLKPGIYRHYKGDEYELMMLAKHSEKEEELVVYRSLKDQQVYVRPLSMWLEEIDFENKTQARFTWLRDSGPFYPEAVVGPIIYNDQGEIFLIKNPKFNHQWTIPGGHIELGESMEEALIRKIHEETSLKIDQIEFINASEGIYPKHFLKKKHFIYLNFFAHLAGGEPVLSREMSEYIWIKPEKALEELDIAESVIGLLELFVARKNENSDSYEDKYKRALADYQNLSKNAIKEKQEFAKFALNDFLQELLPVYDHLKMSISSLPETEKNSAWVQGVEYVLKQFKETLNNKGVEEIKTVGEKFDHNTMEAIEGEGDFIAQEIMSGYMLNGRVIRPAKVKVVKKL